MPLFREDAGTSIRHLGGILFDDEGQPWCKCTPPEPAVQFTVNKEGKNQGKEFWTCAQEIDSAEKCKFFAWDDKVEKIKKQYRLGPEYEKPLDPNEIRARASQAAMDRAGGHRLGSGSYDRHSPPRTPKKRSHSHRNVASSDEEPLAGWGDSDDEVELKPVSQHKNRQNKAAGSLATPDTSPEKKKVKREILEVDLEPNPFLDAVPADAEDPFPALLSAAEKAQKERKKFVAQLKAKDMRIKGLEEELERVKKEQRG
ncbi:hypothetical protein BCR35DRAFT_298939 [Leucosporidium creatinivorum]|uniref:GRF-type domain-containing protein n=1 Tax=Leucosporidium creatinivorum TaxID=106004 RepID=A0A1Y2G2R8_9BASI|nr:hypothetical protein BCR35DRAFT_298939 [Leucosporidium creatinivorum]